VSDQSDQPQTSGEGPLTPGDEPPLASRLPPAPPSARQLPELHPSAQAALSGAASAIEEKPELAVGGAFAGGLVLALILKRLAR
jgi:hypothetical protein